MARAVVLVSILFLAGLYPGRVLTSTDTINAPEQKPITGTTVKSPQAAANPEQPKKKPKSSGNMVLVPAGVFWMGSPVNKGFDNEHPRHKVWLSAYCLDRYPVTFDQYDRFCSATRRQKPDDGGLGRGKMPVMNISWYDAEAYCKWAGKRLPSEAEYEKAVRAGTGYDYFWGSDANQGGEYGWYLDNSLGKTHPVGSKKANPFGFYDIVGNLWEWCQDWYGDTYYADSPNKNPQGPASGQYKVLRGGSWTDKLNEMRSADRGNNIPDFQYGKHGCRCAKTP